jgi:RNA polymerase sigma factor (sigma-70 family)
MTTLLNLEPCQHASVQHLPALDYEALAWSQDWQDHIEDRTTLDQALDALEPHEERYVILARLNGATLSDIARSLRISTEGARQVHERALKRLQAAATGWTPWR